MFQAIEEPLTVYLQSFNDPHLHPDHHGPLKKNCLDKVHSRNNNLNDNANDDENDFLQVHLLLSHSSHESFGNISIDKMVNNKKQICYCLYEQ
uniref:Uncharacterized protein n=1 Tax=Tetranychus urticae TaxID=32264 RepID=T1KG39_TETUR